MEVTVIIPCARKHLETIERAVNSVYEANTIYIACDGFAGNVLPQFGSRIYNLGGYNTLPDGVSAARNRVISIAKTDLILTLDADDELMSNAIPLLINAYQPGTFVYGNWYEDDRLIEAPPPAMIGRKTAHATMLFAKADWERVGGYDVDFNIGGEDWAFQIALIRAGVKPIKVDAPIYRRHLSANGRTVKAHMNSDLIRMLIERKFPGELGIHHAQ